MLHVGVAVVRDWSVDGSIVQALAVIARNIEVLCRSEGGSAGDSDERTHFAGDCSEGDG